MTFLICLLAVVVFLSIIIVVKERGPYNVAGFAAYLIVLGGLLSVIMLSHSLALTVLASIVLALFLIATFVLDR